MSFTPRLNSNGLNSLPYYTSDNPFSIDVGNCTWYAWGRFYEETEPPTRPSLSLGDAYMWYGNTGDGYPRGTTPKLGAVLCFSGGNFSGLGHVAVVEEIYNDGSILVSESGWQGYYFRTNRRYPNGAYPYSNSAEGYTFQGFIYNPTISGMGVSPYVVAAMCGCFWRESNVNPGIWESLIPMYWDYQYEYTNRGGYGLGQWTNVGTPYGRLYNLHTWVTSNGYADGDGNGQLEDILHEDTWYNNGYGRLGFTTLEEFLTSTSTDLPNLVWDFLAQWEGVPGDAYNERLNNAYVCLDYIIQHQNDDPSQYSWISVNNYLSQSQILNNVMMVYFFFGGYGPVPPVPPIPTKKRFILYCNKRKFMKRRGLTWR